eukprot:gene28680-35584_t
MDGMIRFRADRCWVLLLIWPGFCDTFATAVYTVPPFKSSLSKGLPSTPTTTRSLLETGLSTTIIEPSSSAETDFVSALSSDAVSAIILRTDILLTGSESRPTILRTLEIVGECVKEDVPASCTLAGGDANIQSIFAVGSGGSLCLRALELRDVESAAGAALRLETASKATLIDCILHNNTAYAREVSDKDLPVYDEGFGGAIYCGENSTLVLISCQLSDNGAHRMGGAVASKSKSFIKIINSSLSGNNVGEDGGALYLEGPIEVEISGASINDNEA